MWRICLAAFGLLVFADYALAYCSKPDAPYCASRYTKFDDEYEFDRCKREMQSYRSDVEDFVSCIKRKTEELTRQGNEAIDDYREAIASFNRRAGG